MIPALQTLQKAICANFPLAKIYGEAHETIVSNDGTAYATIENPQACAVDDTYDLVVFWTRISADPQDQVKGGNVNKVSRKVTFRLAGNAKNANAEQVLTYLVNSTIGIEYAGSSFDGKSVAANLFGIQEYNFETHFFSIDFTVLEKISCPTCK